MTSRITAAPIDFIIQIVRHLQCSEFSHRRRMTTIIDWFCKCLEVIKLFYILLVRRLYSHLHHHSPRLIILTSCVDEKNPNGEVGTWMEHGDKHPDFWYTFI